MHAREAIAAAALLDAADLPGFATAARQAGRDLLELLPALEAERSARIALQERADRLQEIVGKGAYYMAIAYAAHEAQATMVAKRELERIHTETPLPVIEFGSRPA
jgi:hypothetical protein